MSPAEFNKRVWAALNLIPRGRVTTYKELAKYLGLPKAARATNFHFGSRGFFYSLDF
ncbi:MAG: MGMT family protein [Candidatus Falkowbacteria bacterium]